MTLKELIEEIKDGDWSDKFYQNYPILARAMAIILGVSLVWILFFLILLIFNVHL